VFSGPIGAATQSGYSGESGEAIRLVSEGHSVPFSKGLLATTLTATGLAPDRAYGVAVAVESQLVGRGAVEISVEDLRQMVELVLQDNAGKLYVDRYRKWNRLGREDKPVIIMIGGATGVGKSTMAAQIAERLGLVRIISTDSVREVMRAFFAQSLMPSIHYSSYEADKAVRIPLGSGLNSHVVGFMEQAEMVNVGMKAILDRAIKERTSMVLEGVHLVPGMLSMHDQVAKSDALVLPLVIAVRDADLHRSHFLVRERETSGRRVLAGYLKGFEEIRRIQEFVLERAESEGTLIIDNESIDEAVGTVVEALYDLIEEEEEREADDV
jgi:2-phosphoglycerate kinase